MTDRPAQTVDGTEALVRAYADADPCWATAHHRRHSVG